MNMQALMKQAQNMQKDMLKAKEEIDSKDFVGKSSLVTVNMKGDKTVKSVDFNIDEDFELDDLDMLKDMIVVAFNDGIKQIDEYTDKKMSKYGNIPGLF